MNILKQLLSSNKTNKGISISTPKHNSNTIVWHTNVCNTNVCSLSTVNKLGLRLTKVNFLKNNSHLV